MYHYQKNIGDYRSATMHLSLVEHGVYNQLLDWYYLDEQPLPLDNRTLFRRLSAKSETEQQAVLDVLSEMFSSTDKGWIHRRVEREIAQYKAKADQARSAGKLGGRPLKNGTVISRNQDGLKKEPGAKPTANHKPVTNSESKDSGAKTPDPIFGDGLKFLCSKGLDDKLARSFLGKLRKDAGDLAVIRALDDAKTNDISEPVPWLTRAVKARPPPGQQPWD